VFDVVAFPAQAPPTRAALDVGKPVITGVEAIGLQAAVQFVRYAGVTPTPDQTARASVFSRE